MSSFSRRTFLATGLLSGPTLLAHPHHQRRAIPRRAAPPAFASSVRVSPGPLAHTTQFQPLDGAGGVVETGHLEGQLRWVWNQFSTAMLAAGSPRERWIRLHVGVRDDAIGEFARRWLARQFRAPGPALTMVAGQLPHSDALVALDGVGAVTRANLGGGTVQRRRFPRLIPTVSAPVTIHGPGAYVFVSGQAEKDANPRRAAERTLAALFETLRFLRLEPSRVVSIRAFLKPISAAPEIEQAVAAAFPGSEPPQLAFVEWESSLPIEIELIAVGPPANRDAPLIEFLTPPGTQPSPVYSKVTRVNRGNLVYFSSLLGPARASAEVQVRTAMEALRHVAEEAGSDLRHLAKATYFVSQEDTSQQLNRLRPEFYDPQRPPAASKALVRGTGTSGCQVALDMIGVVRESEPPTPGGRQPRP